ncbi:MAG: DNA modification methylase [Oligosphaeraceae bacterium]
MMNIADIRPYERNPRHNEEAVDAVARSIREFGFRSPVILDGDKVIVAGHTRVLAAKSLGMTEVPCVIAADLTPEQVRAFRIADNRTAEIAEWDYELLPVELKELQTNGFDMSLLGFDTSELERLLADTKDEVAEGETEPDAVPDAPDVPVSRPGEVYLLGSHRLMCGDSTSQKDTARLMGAEKARLYLTDPPYNVALEGGNGLTIANDNMPTDEFRRFLDRAFGAAASVLEPGSVFYIFHGDSESANFRLAAAGAGLEVHETLYWVKNALVLGRFDYQYITESCLYGWTPGAAHRWFGDRSQTNALRFDKPRRNDVHPSMKPVEMLVYLVRNSSARGDVVLDNFGGSGSTLIACEQTGRVCRAMELDPRYCDVIRRRWAEFVHGEGCDWQALTPAEGREDNDSKKKEEH